MELRNPYRSLSTYVNEINKVQQFATTRAESAVMIRGRAPPEILMPPLLLGGYKFKENLNYDERNPTTEKLSREDLYQLLRSLHGYAMNISRKDSVYSSFFNFQGIRQFDFETDFEAKWKGFEKHLDCHHEMLLLSFYAGHDIAFRSLDSMYWKYFVRAKKTLKTLKHLWFRPQSIADYAINICQKHIDEHFKPTVDDEESRQRKEVWELIIQHIKLCPGLGVVVVNHRDISHNFTNIQFEKDMVTVIKIGELYSAWLTRVKEAFEKIEITTVPDVRVQ